MATTIADGGWSSHSFLIPLPLALARVALVVFAAVAVHLRSATLVEDAKVPSTNRALLPVDPFFIEAHALFRHTH
ncbi:MAG: hypothetical protein ACRENP_23010 [Longimicrobiales bacterium]